MATLFSKIEETHDCCSLFRVGPYNRIDNARRIEFPELRVLSLDQAVNVVYSLVCEQMSLDKSYLVLVFENDENIFPEAELKSAMCSGIENNHIDAIEYYDGVNEMHVFLRAFRSCPAIVHNIIKMGLSRHLDYEPYLEPEYFFLSGDLSTALNIFDDRGMDIVYL